MTKLTFEEANAYVFRWCNSFERMKMILSLRGLMSAPDWWRLLGDLWDTCDNIAVHKNRLRQILLKANPTNLRAMMRTHERRALAAMPDEITVYRGCYDVNRDGLSWSLTEDIATRFTTLNRYHRTNDAALLLTGKASKARIVLKLSRREREVICPLVEITHERRTT